MRTQDQFLREMTALLERAGIPYMVTGSIAATYYGRPRTTQDVDLVVEADETRLATFVADAIRDGYYADPADARDAHDRRTMFNIIDARSGYKLDVIIRKDRDFSREEFRRRRAAELPGASVTMVSPEDSILTKLEWARESASERQYQDALGIALVQGPSLDTAYLRRWAEVLGLAGDLQRLFRDATLA